MDRSRRDAIAVGLALLLGCVSLSASAQNLEPPKLAPDQSLIAKSPQGLQSASARVLLELELSAEGNVRSAKSIEVSVENGDGASTQQFAAAAIAHAAALRFEPARHDGSTVAATLRVEIRFEPAPAPAPEPAPARAPGSSPRAHTHSHPHQHTHTHAHSDKDLHYGAHARVANGTRKPRASAASEIDLELGALRDVPRNTAEQYLTLSPGLVLQNHAGPGHASAIFLRGFDAGEGEDLEVLVDGIPMNEPSNAHAHGYADTLFLIPEIVERVQVLQGPFDPRQGDFAVAGSAGYELGVRERGLRLAGTYGEYGERRGLALWAPESASRGTFAAADIVEGDGYAENRAHHSLRANARYEDDEGPLQYSLFGAAQAAGYDSAGIVREDDFDARRLPCAPDEDAQFFCTYDPEQGGSTARGLLSGALRWERPGRAFELQAYFGRRELRIRENFTGFLLDPRGDGLEQRYDATTFGLKSSYRFEPHAFGQRQRFELGLEARHDSARSRLWRLRREEAVPYATVFDSDLGLTHGGLFARAELTPLPWLTLIAGARADVFAFNALDLAAPESDRSGERLPVAGSDAWGTAISPRGSLHFALDDSLSWVLSAGTGIRSSDAQALSEGESAPFARAISVETGPVSDLHLLPSLRLELRAFAFATRVTEDLLFDAARGRNVPVGPSNRYGAGGSARLRVSDLSDTLASFTWSEARIADEDDSIFDLSAGDVLPFVPRAVLRVDHASSVRFDIAGETFYAGAALGLSFIGSRPLPLGTFSEPVWDLAASLRARWRMVELALAVENLLDARNRVAEFNHPSNFAGPEEPSSLRAVRHFAAGPPRRLLLTLTLYLDERDLALGEGP